MYTRQANLLPPTTTDNERKKCVTIQIKDNIQAELEQQKKKKKRRSVYIPAYVNCE